MIKHVKGDLLDAQENLILHQVNCQGAFGAGVAAQIRKRFPKVYEQYTSCVKRFAEKESLLGELQIIKVDSKRAVVNVFSQLDYGREDKVYTDYDALREALKKVCELAKKHKLSIALPYLMGCGLAGGDWNIVYSIIKEELEGLRVAIYEL